MRSKLLTTIASIAVLSLLVAESPAALLHVLLQGTMVYQPERLSERCVFFGVDTVSGSYSIDYGSPAWSADYDTKFDDLTLGKRVRFGKDQWTTLDTSCPLSFGKIDVKAGLYYCALERSKKGEFFLVLLDHEDVRKARLDPFASDRTKGGLMLPLEHAAASEPAKALSIHIEKDAQNEKEQTLTIAFGPHRLTTRVKARV